MPIDSPTSSLDGHRRLVAALRQRLGGDVEMIETHISTVLLWGETALKLKKPVDFGFLDFSTLERRRHFCEEELRLNRRYAPHLYLGITRITGSPDEPVLDADGESLGPFEYAVRMRRFDQSALLDRVAREGRLTGEHIDALAAELAAFHAVAAVSTDSHFGGREHVVGPVEENFRVLAGCELSADDRQRIDRLHRWSDATAGRLAISTFAERQHSGAVRECHGDLHLGNMLLESLEGGAEGEKITFFDGIEFNPDLRWSDVMSEVAFTMMDLFHHERTDLAFRLLDGYLARTGDYAGLAVLPYYVVYRAMVRAKVACLRSRQAATDAERDRAVGDVAAHARLAEGITQGPAPWLLITHGVSGSGKSTAAAALVSPIGAVRVRSDLERKRLAGIEGTARSGSPVAGGLYADSMTEATYARIETAVAVGLEAGYPMIVDAACLRRSQRERFTNLAARLKVPHLILDFHAPEDVLRERLTTRLEAGADPSEADAAVLEHQLATRQPLEPDEQTHALRIGTTRPDWLAELTRDVAEQVAPRET